MELDRTMMLSTYYAVCTLCVFMMNVVAPKQRVCADDGGVVVRR